MRVCVCTVVHHPEDARIAHRQIRALLAAGHKVTYAAPFGACGVIPWPEVDPVDMPRAVGRNRLAALRAARRTLAGAGADADIVLVHDPELLLALPRRRGGRPVLVWDVHEDTAAALPAKGWVPAPLRRPLAPLVLALERRAERRLKLLLAEEGYRARFARPHPVVPNTTYVPDTPPPPPGADRVVYLGHLSAARGAADLVELARLLRGEGVTVELIGPSDPQMRPVLRAAADAGLLRWHGFVPNDRALRLAEGALAGLSLLRDAPNYRHSLPTKIVEYMAHGLPVITTPLPAAVAIVEPGRCGTVVDYADPAGAARAVLRLRDDAELRQDMGRRGYAEARARFHWPDHARHFVRQLEEWAAR